MNQQLKVVYHYHSGFSVQCGETLLIFDYWEGEGGTLAEVGRVTPAYLRQFKNIFVFVSHIHPDHYDQVIYSWKNDFPDITYIVAGDMPIGVTGKRIQPGQTRTFEPGLEVSAFRSTDLGVAFLVKVDGMTVFHAGDLNFWHWRMESTLREIEAAERDFYNAVEPLKGLDIDVAMFPVDPRQGLMYDAGANHFILTVKPRVFIPMHWQDRPEVAVEFARHSRNAQTEVLALTRPGTTAAMNFDSVIDIRVIEPPKDFSELPTGGSTPEDPFDGTDPFSDSDLPVDL